MKFPGVAIDNIRRQLARTLPRRCWRCRIREPTIMINAAMAQHFEMLSPAMRLHARLCGIKTVGHADAFNRALRHAIHAAQLRKQVTGRADLR